MMHLQGIEVAAALVDKAKSVSLADSGETPFQRTLGKEVGNAVRKVCFNTWIVITGIYAN